MAEDGNDSLGVGIAAGLVGGLVGSWVMLKFIEGLGPQLERVMQGRPEPTVEDARGQAERTESVTMQAAETFYEAGAGRELTHAERERAAEGVHYVFGALMGLGYGVVAEYAPVLGMGMGAAFGTVLWATTDLVAVPAAGFAAWPGEEPGSAHVAHLAAHLVYGMTMEGTRRLVRWGLRG